MRWERPRRERPPRRRWIELGEAEPLLPVERERYLAEIAETVRAYREETLREAEAARDAHALERVLRDAAEAAPELRRRREQALDSLER